MKKYPLIVGIIVVIVFVSLILLSLNRNNTNVSTYESDKMLNNSFNITQIAISGTKYYVYAAVSLPQQEEGYMNSSTIGNCDGKEKCIGMLFIFGNYSDECFWMENTLIPLRQTWLNNTGYPTYSYNGIPLSQKVVCANGRYVLETSPNFTVNGQVEINES